MLISQLIKGSKEKFFLLNQIFDENIRRLQGKSFSAKNAIKLKKIGPKCNLVSKILIIIININLFF